MMPLSIFLNELPSQHESDGAMFQEVGVDINYLASLISMQSDNSSNLMEINTASVFPALSSTPLLLIPSCHGGHSRVATASLMKFPAQAVHWGQLVAW
jgi:hypothetical protein